MKKTESKKKNHHFEMEFIDIIDKKEKKIAVMEKHFAHKLGKRHYAVHIFVLNAKNELILQKRREDRFLQPGSWDTSVGGHVPHGETLLSGAMRECEEELRVHSPLHFLGKLSVIDKQRNYLNDEVVAYYFTKTKEEPYYQRAEIAGLKSLPLKKVSDFIMRNQSSPMLLAGWKKFGKKIMRMVE